MTTEVRKKKIAAWEKRLKPAEEDYVNSKYFIITKTLLCVFGAWPFQSRLKAYPRRLLLYSILVYNISAQFTSAVKLYRKGDQGHVLLPVIFLGFFFTFGSKFSMALLSQNRFKELFKFMKDNWRSIKDEEEKKLLHEPSKFIWILSTAYFVFNIYAILVCVTTPLTVPMLLNTYFPTNETRPPTFVLDSAFPFDKQKRFFTVWMIESVSIAVPVIGYYSIDSCLVSCASHIVALLNVLICRLNALSKYEKKDSNPESLKGARRNKIRESIILHNRIIDFADILNRSYSPTFIIMEILAILSIAIEVNCFQEIISEPQDYIRHLGVLVSIFVHIYYISFNGQRIINFSEKIYNAVWNTDWYNYPKEDQKMMKFMMMRTHEPLQLTSAGIHPINFEYFGFLMKTTVSYIIVITSFRLGNVNRLH